MPLREGAPGGDWRSGWVGQSWMQGPCSQKMTGSAHCCNARVSAAYSHHADGPCDRPNGVACSEFCMVVWSRKNKTKAVPFPRSIPPPSFALLILLLHWRWQMCGFAPAGLASLTFLSRIAQHHGTRRLARTRTKRKRLAVRRCTQRSSQGAN